MPLRKESGRYRNPNYCLLLNRSSVVIARSQCNAKGGMAPRFLHREYVLVMVVPARSCTCSLTADPGRVESARERREGRGGGGGKGRFVQGYEASPRIPTEVKG